VSPLGLDVHIARLVSTAAQAAQLQSEPFIITTIGPDRKGLMAGISEVIARHDGNITNLQAVIKGGDNSGDYIMIYEVDIPPQTDQQVLYQDLKNRAKELKLDIDIQHRNIFETMYRI
jgi:glycine cleavage system transcriptional repressor